MGSNNGPVLSNAPQVFRPASSKATHWVQAVAGVGPWSLEEPQIHAVCVRVRTDGVQLTWTPLGLEAAPACEELSAVAAAPLLASLHPLPEPEVPLLPAADLDAWRQLRAEAAEGLRELRQKVDEVGDIARLQALQAAVLHLVAQPGLFGL